MKQPLFSVDQIRQLERFACDRQGFSLGQLMQNAGQAAFECLKKVWPEAKTILVCCGKGNNAGDGYVLAKLAYEAGLRVSIVALCKPESLQGLVLEAAKATHDLGIPLSMNVACVANDVDVIVDALLGTGLQGQVESPFLEAITAINANASPVLALDIPSGVCAETGAVLSEAVHAATTLTFIGLKPGLFTGEGVSYCGDVVRHPIGVPDSLMARVSAKATLVTSTPALTKRKKNCHKGDFGQVLVLGGNQGMPGAPVLSALAASRVGAGLSMVGVHETQLPLLHHWQPDLLCFAVDLSSLSELLKRTSVVVIGPGLGQDEWAKGLLSIVLSAHLPTVIDADALNLLSIHPVACGNAILTPHPKEASRLLDCEVLDIQADRFQAISALKEKYQGYWLLKGAGTLFETQTGLAVCGAGNPGMASAGMGDVLAGCIAGLLAQGLETLEALEKGVLFHAMAGDLLAKSRGEIGLMATDLLNELPRVINETLD